MFSQTIMYHLVCDPLHYWLYVPPCCWIHLNVWRWWVIFTEKTFRFFLGPDGCLWSDCSFAGEVDDVLDCVCLFHHCRNAHRHCSFLVSSLVAWGFFVGCFLFKEERSSVRMLRINCLSFRSFQSLWRVCRFVDIVGSSCCLSCFVSYTCKQLG